MKFGQKCEIWSKLSNVVNVGRGYVMNVGKRLCNPERLISQSVTKVGIELLGQLKNQSENIFFQDEPSIF